MKILPALLAVACFATPAWAQVVGGVDDDPSSAALRVDGDTYEPPTLFNSQLPLNGSWNGNSAARAYYVSALPALPGNGAILAEGSNFGVTGYSPPNFLAYNCGATNANGTVPTLPQLIAFTGGPVTRVSINAGTGIDPPGDFLLVAFDAGFSVLDFGSITLGAAMQNVSTSAPGTAFALLVSDVCRLVVDDLRFD